MTLQIITEMTTSEMVAEYNLLTGKSIKKFSDRKTGERQLTSARQMAETKKLLAGKPAKGEVEAPAPVAKKEKKPASPRVNIDGRSAAIKLSWINKDTAEKRASHHKVSVGGVVYRSVKEAFEKLGLPLEKHIKFRMELKEKGKAVFEGHHFKLVEQQEMDI